ncbi:hypothetical protein ACSBR2_030805 [Camellia fascicularis]
MRHMMINRSLLPTTILAFYFVCSNHVLAGFERYQVHIISAVPDKPTPLLFHCQSKDDDLGYYAVRNGAEFRWSFRMNFLDSTLFFCRFQWNSKDTSFDVFNRHLVPYCETPALPFMCVWVVKPDAFYLGNSDSNLTQLHTW